jgi:hypothetical protein
VTNSGQVWNNRINATDRIKDIEEGRQTDDEIAYAKRYLNELLEQTNSIKIRHFLMIISCSTSKPCLLQRIRKPYFLRGFSHQYEP